ncbi:LamG-like jellyroll fold domain-containing protein [Ferruginibacter sp.]
MKTSYGLFVLLFFFSIQAKSQNNYAVSFNGLSSADCGTSPGFNMSGTSLTVEAWIYPTVFATNYWEGSIISKDAQNNTGYVLRCGALGKLSFVIALAGNVWAEVISADNTLALNKWQHVAGVYNGSQLLLYRDGVLVASGAETHTLLQDASYPVKIGGSPGTWVPARNFTGGIDEARVWNVAKTAAQLKYNMFRGVTTGTGLVASYQMTNGSGTSITDNSGNGNTATISTGGGWLTSPVRFAANALSFDGIDDQVTVPYNSSLDISTNITLEAWVYATKNSGIQNVISKSSFTTNTGYIFPRTNDGWNTVSFYLFIAGGWRNVSVAYPSLNAWHHLAATYDGSYMRIYIDGVQATAVAQTGAIATNSNILTLGSQFGYVNEFFGGNADEFRIWNVARTPAQIAAGMNTELDPTAQTGLVSYYNLNQGIASGANAGLITVIDQSGSNNGTLSNFILSGLGSNFVTQGSGMVVLPVQGLTFTAQQQAGKGLLKWSTATEQNSKEFIIQRSSNGSDWTDIGSITAAGTSSTTKQYSFTDPAVLKGTYYYRLIQKDMDGRAAYSEIRYIKFSEKSQLFAVLTNPVANGQLAVQVNSDPVELSLYDPAGRLTWKKQFNTGKTTVNVANLSKGIYLLKAGEKAEKIVIQ